ncbi:hypothetical protein [Alienimonas chondri]|uniref:Uncharacterized protein n=1 Tax=Alienimonas chondri TaxID=2681879 RepID=A0ABX1V8U8_9PLAN|nr:hypothetical protein [Alienimonas chondri]NNJ24322.1 hypothetical protein [Alienimonas chondri]
MLTPFLAAAIAEPRQVSEYLAMLCTPPVIVLGLLALAANVVLSESRR